MKRRLFHLVFWTMLMAVLGRQGQAQTPHASGFAFSLGSLGSELSGGVAVDSQGNIYTTGNFAGTIDFDPGGFTTTLPGGGVFVAKYNPAGAFLWARQLGGMSSGMSSSDIAVDGQGNVYTTGTFRGTDDFDPGPGTFSLTSLGHADIFVSKLDPQGNFLWARQIGNTRDDSAINIAVDGQGNVYTAGFFVGTMDFDPGPGVFMLTSTSFLKDGFVSKWAANGAFVWAKKLSGLSNDTTKVFDVAVDGLGNVYTTGAFWGTVDFDPGPGTFTFTNYSNVLDMFVLKLSANGTFAWAKRMNGSGSAESYHIAVDPLGNVYTAGFLSGTVDFDPGPGMVHLTSTGAFDMFVSKLTTNGAFLWANQLGGSGAAVAVGGMAVDGQGNVYTTGSFSGTVDFNPGPGTFTLTSAGDSDVFVLKLTTNGTFVWSKQMGGTSVDFGAGVAVYGLETVYTTGSFWGSADFDPGDGIVTLTSAHAYDIFVSKIGPRVISGRVWLDLNGDGIQDADEPGVAGVAIELWDTIEVLDIQVTEANGTYYFPGLFRASRFYSLSFFQPTLSCSFTLQDAGNDDSRDSDVDANGSTLPFMVFGKFPPVRDAGLLCDSSSVVGAPGTRSIE